MTLDSLCISKDREAFWASLITWHKWWTPLTDQMFKIPRSTLTAPRASTCPTSPLGPRGCEVLDKDPCVPMTSAMRREGSRVGGTQPFPVLKVRDQHHRIEFERQEEQRQPCGEKKP